MGHLVTKKREMVEVLFVVVVVAVGYSLPPDDCVLYMHPRNQGPPQVIITVHDSSPTSDNHTTIVSIRVSPTSRSTREGLFPKNSTLSPVFVKLVWYSRPRKSRRLILKRGLRVGKARVQVRNRARVTVKT